MKKIISLLLAAVLAAGILTPALAVTDGEAEQAAWILYNFGLFQGVAVDERDFPDFALDRRPSGPRESPCWCGCWGRNRPP